MIRVMVVDDEMRIRNGIAKYIEQNIAGFTVPCCFRDGEEAIAYLAENDVDIVISDIRMIRVSGIELAKYIYETKPYIKVVMLSGYQEFQYARSAISYGVSAYLSKPTNFQELRETLHTVAGQLQKAEKGQGDIVQYTKAMFELVVQRKATDGMMLLEEIFDAAKTLDTDRLGKYLCDFFEILYDKICLYIKVDLKVQGIDYVHIAQARTRSEAQERAREILSDIFKLTRSEEDDSEDYIMKKTKEYINQNFSKDISLQQVADFVYLNPVYFSRLFKKRTGQNFSDYLLNKRMKHAAKLLLGNAKVSEVSQACGYNNSGYFARIFKEYYKCTPKEYGRKYRDNQ